MGNFLKRSRHGTTFYFRRRVPDDLRQTVGQPYLTKSLETGDRREAIMRARLLAAKTDIFFANLRTMAPKHRRTAALKIDYALSLDITPSGKKRAVALDVQPGEEVSAALAVQALQAALDENTPAPSLQAQVAPRRAGKTLSEIWEGYKAEKIHLGEQAGVTGGWKDGENTARYDHWPHVRALIEHLGDVDVAEVEAEDIEAFRHQVITDPKGGKPRNKEKRLQRAGAILRWAKGKRIISDDFRELFAYPGKIEDCPYLKFDDSDLKALFESGAYRSNAFKKPSEYWLMVLGLFTGARLNELCQLTTTDIGKHDGIDTITILDEGFKRLKTIASRRIIPIHSKLIELGFLDFVRSVPSGRIFPELPESSARPGDFGREPSRKFTDYRRNAGVGGDKLNPETGKWEGENRKTYHSFRSTLIDALRKANVPKDRRTRLAGHDYNDTQDKNYTGGDVLTMFDFRTLKDDIETVRYDVAFTPYRP